MQAAVQAANSLIGKFSRRFVTILAADVAEYCRVMGLDDELTLSRLMACRQIMNEFVREANGRMFGVAGDSWMAEFASPVAAVRCAVKGQRAIEELNADLPEVKKVHFRMGLHMGHVLSGGPDLFGDDVNIAARLQQLCRPGHLVLSEAVHKEVDGKVGLRFNPLGLRQLKHIAVSVPAFAAEVIEISSSHLPQGLNSTVDVSQPIAEFEGKPAVAVLPFHTLGGIPGNEHIGEGFADDLINGLSKVRWFPVISRFSSFKFMNHALDTRSIGRALGARYLVTGTVRLAEQDLRLIVDLIDAENGLNLWSHRCQLDFQKLFDVQDEITAGIVSILDAEVERAEQSRLLARKAEDLDTWQLIRRGIWHLYKFTKEDSTAARSIFEDALRRDPDSTEARINLAWWHFWDIWSKRRDLSLLKETERLGREAMRIDQRDARSHLMVGIARMMMGDPVQARAHYLDAIHFNPSLSTAHAVIGSSYILSGEPEKAIAPLLLSIRLNPHDLHSFHFLGELAMAFYMDGKWGKACEFAERSVQLRSGYWYAKAILIASLARSGRIEKAREIAAASSRKFSIEQIEWLPFTDRKWKDYLLGGLELADLEFLGVDQTESRNLA